MDTELERSISTDHWFWIGLPVLSGKHLIKCSSFSSLGVCLSKKAPWKLWLLSAGCYKPWMHSLPGLLRPLGGDGRLLESWRLLQGVRRQVFNTIQLTPVYLTLKFGSHFLFLHLSFPSSKLGRGQEVRLAAICPSMMRSFSLGYMHLFLLSAFSHYWLYTVMRSFCSKGVFIGRRRTPY